VGRKTLINQSFIQSDIVTNYYDISRTDWTILIKLTEYLVAPTDDLIRFWRSKVKVTAGHQGHHYLWKLYLMNYLSSRNESYWEQEIRSVEHGICPIAEFTSPWLNCAHSNRILYPVFCWCRGVHVLLKNIKWILKSHYVVQTVAEIS